MMNPTELHDLLHYNPETGYLIWKVNAARRRKAGQIAGCRAEKGRVLIGIRGKLYKAHRIIWAMTTGQWPTHQIDHINEDPSDNRWENLREATKSQNMKNITKIKSNTSGYKGVYWNKQCSRWMAKIVVNGKQHHLGLFLTPEEASVAYQAGQKKYHPYATEAAK